MGIIDYLPVKLRDEAAKNVSNGLEEIRVRAGLPVQYIFSNAVKNGVITDMEDISEMINYMSEYSLHTIEKQLYEGFFTVEGGHRVGVAGVTEIRDDSICSMHNISSLNIRIARQIKDIAKPVIDYIRNKDRIYNTLIASAPGMGKTTCLRDCIRILSDGDEVYKPLKISIVDERSEIAACCNGVAQNDIGRSSDVMDNCPKAIGMRMLLRSMSPDIIAVDELGDEDDFKAIDEMSYRGVNILGTMHANDIDDLKKKIMSDRLERIMLITRNEKGDRVYDIYDKDYRMLHSYVCDRGAYK